jgi:tetratricopeptide (TPR) repeat protein
MIQQRSHSCRAHAVLATALALAACGWDSAGDDPSGVTFTRDVAPILYENCAACHNPNGPGPFSILAYDAVKERAPLIAAYAEQRIMPPWLPEYGKGDFLGTRRLSEGEIQVLQEWALAGAPRGRRRDLPDVPDVSDEWQLGEPDLVLEAPAYTVTADGYDVYRNLVVPVPITETRYVRALEFRPGRTGVVHHATVMVDFTPSSREMDALDPEPGFDGMYTMSGAASPEGYFIGWTPGKFPFAGREGMAWRLDPGTDLIVQIHLRPLGEAATVRVRVGLYFADEPPSKIPVLIKLGSESIDIPAGDTAYVVEDSYQLPVPVQVLGVYPHAHYLGKTMEGTATLPDGSTRWLIRIPQWDFNWQDEYHYAAPIDLPAGTVVRMRFTYDNSVGNPHNPNSPPERVMWGARSVDEMADLVIQALPRDPADGDALTRDFALKKKPMEDARTARLHYNTGTGFRREGRFDEAIAEFEAALALNPRHAPTHNNLGITLAAQGKADESIPHYEEALRLDPGFAEAYFNLAEALRATQRLGEAVTAYERSLALQPAQPVAHYNLATALDEVGRGSEAVRHYREAITLRPSFARAHYNLGNALAARGDLAEAITHFEAAVEITPGYAEAHQNLGTALSLTAQPHRAIEHFQLAARAQPDWVMPYVSLAQLLATHEDPAVRDAQAAVQAGVRAAQLTNYGHPVVLDALAIAYAAAEQYGRAVETAQRAVQLAEQAGATELAANIRLRLEVYRQQSPPE